MQDAHVIFWRTGYPNFPEGGFGWAKPIWMHTPEFEEFIGEGWSIVSHQFVSADERGLLFSFLITRELGESEIGRE